jgi:hypothetical protein
MAELAKHNGEILEATQELFSEPAGSRSRDRLREYLIQNQARSLAAIEDVLKAILEIAGPEEIEPV